MDIHLPDHIVSELERIAPTKAAKRLRVRAGKATVDILRLDATGFTVAAASPRLRGAVAIVDGARHLADCLIVAAERDGPVTRYEYKRWTGITETAPLDYARDDSAPVALLR